MILLAMKLSILLAMFHYKVARDYIPKEMLLLFQHIESLWEYRSHRTPAHLDPQILPIGLISCPSFC